MLELIVAGLGGLILGAQISLGYDRDKANKLEDLQDENRDLKIRLAELELAIEVFKDEANRITNE